MPNLTKAQHSVLKTELLTDPKAQGYALTLVNYLATADKVNKPIAAAGTIGREPIETTVLQESFVASEFNALSAVNLSKLTIIMSQPTVRIASTVIQAQLSLIFGAASATTTAIKALVTRPASRAVVLFGQGVIVDAGDVEIALTHIL